MAMMTVEILYDQYIKPLSIQERLRLVALITQRLVAESPSEADKKPERSIVELHGLGQEIWEGIDAQEFTNYEKNRIIVRNET